MGKWGYPSMFASEFAGYPADDWSGGHLFSHPSGIHWICSFCAMSTWPTCDHLTRQRRNFFDTSTVAGYCSWAWKTSANQRWVCWKNTPFVDHVPIETSIFREFPASHVWLGKDYFPIKTCPSPRFTPSDQWTRNSAHSDFSFTTSQLTSTDSRHLHKSTLDI